MKAITVCLSLICLAFGSKAQTFELTSFEGIEDAVVTTEYGNGLSLHDIDRDGWVDLTVCRGYQNPLFFRNIEGEFTPWDISIVSNTMLRHFNWVDIDNDGDADACLTSGEGYIEIWAQTAEMQFVNITEDSGMIDHTEDVYSNSWGDYDRDGLLDCYFPVYDTQNGQVNALYKNMGDNTFELVSSGSPVNDGVNASFIGTFVDFNQDIWPEIFVINDRLVSDNHLYKNNEGVFEDISESSNTDQALFTMSNTIGDINNDGHLDIFMSNNPEGYLLLRNDGDETFTDITAAAGVGVFEFGWAGNFSDFDNDGFQDLHVCTMPFWENIGQNRLFKNNAGSSFTEITESAGMGPEASESYCSVVGDVDKDGHQDLIILNANPHGLQYWHNNGNNNNWLEVSMDGVISNSDAIGTRLDAYAGALSLTRYTLCGESYLSQNSPVMHFGLGLWNTVDSLIVTYPSGHIDRYYDLPVNQELFLTEGETLILALDVQGAVTLCEGESLTISSNAEIPVTWQDGSVSESFTITESGSYYASLNTVLGYEVISDTLEVVFQPEIQFVTQVFNIPCADSTGGTSIVSITPNTTISWSPEDYEGWFLEGLGGGTYTYTITDAAGCSVTDDFSLSEPSVIGGGYNTEDVSCFGESDGFAVLYPTGGTGMLTTDWGANDPSALPAGTYYPVISDVWGCQTTFEITIGGPPDVIPEITVTDVICHGEDTGTVQATITGGTGLLEIDFNDQNPEALESGIHYITVTDETNCTFIFEYVIEEPDALIFDIQEVSDDESGAQVDLTIEGGISPYEVSWSDGSVIWEEEDPFLPLDVLIDLTITDSNGCTIAGSWTDLNEPAALVLAVYPNPAGNQLWIQFHGSGTAFVRDSHGRMLSSQTLSGDVSMIDVSDLAAGHYVLSIISDVGNVTTSWIKE